MQRTTLSDREMNGFVMSPKIYELHNEVVQRCNRSSQPMLFIVNCGGVDGFTSESLADLARMRRELRWEGHELKLTNCSSRVVDEMIVPLFFALLEGWSDEGVDQRGIKRTATSLAHAA